jgi:transcriptional regulator with XRE-family HTH domain
MPDERRQQTTRRTLREWREEVFGLTQAEFAAKIGSSQTLVSQWERGKKHPRVTSRRKVAERLGLRYDQILWTPRPPQQPDHPANDSTAG